MEMYATFYRDYAEKDDFGLYTVVVTSNNGCGQSELSVHIGHIGIMEYDNPEFTILSVLPNPVTNEATINFILPQDGNATLTLLDVAGREVSQLASAFFHEGNNTITITNKLHHVSSGAYFIILEFNGRKTSINITINK
jgi:hypothetical protein